MLAIVRRNCNMDKSVVQVEVKNVLATSAGSAIFLGNEEKVFVIYVDHSVGSAINMFLHGTPKPRPQTHDLFADVLTALGAHVDRVVINDFTDTVFFARLIIVAENELAALKIIALGEKDRAQGKGISAADSRAQLLAARQSRK